MSFTQIMQGILQNADTELAAPRLSPHQRSRRDAAKQKAKSQRIEANRKRRSAALVARKTKLQEQLSKHTARGVKLKDALKDCEAAIKATAKGL